MSDNFLELFSDYLNKKQLTNGKVTPNDVRMALNLWCVRDNRKVVVTHNGKFRRLAVPQADYINLINREMRVAATEGHFRDALHLIVHGENIELVVFLPYEEVKVTEEKKESTIASHEPLA